MAYYQRLCASGPQDDEVIVRSLPVEDAANLLDAGTGGEFGALAIHERAGGAAFDACNQQNTYRHDEEGGDDNEHGGKRESHHHAMPDVGVMVSHGFQNQSWFRRHQDPCSGRLPRAFLTNRLRSSRRVS